MIERALGEGPRPEDYQTLRCWLEALHGAVLTGLVGEQELAQLHSKLGDALSVQTLQGFARSKPYGYAGDFEMMDRIYTQHCAEEPALGRWDAFFHQQPAARAVRNRKSYFHTVLAANAARRYSAFENRVLNTKPPVLHVLNVASGPAREVLEWFSDTRQWPVAVDCIESDPRAIEYAERLCRDHLDRVHFRCANAMRFRTRKRYDVCWSGGLFDCLPDDLFVKLLRRLLEFVHVGGEVVIGNFGAENPSRPYMELLGDWKLWHRDAKALRRLAVQAGVAPSALRVGREAEGVNLFLHIRVG